MSLPPTQKPKNSNRSYKNTAASPLDPALVEDVQRKLKIYAVVQALRRGRLPDNRQLEDALVFLRDTILTDERKTASYDTKLRSQGVATNLSDEGRAVILDFRDIVETVRQLLKQKNADEVFQDFVYHTSGIHFSASRPEVDLPVSIEVVRKDGETAAHHLRTLLRLLLTNREARKLLRDSKLILRDLFAQTAVAVAERTRPSEREMRSIDDAALTQDWAGSAEDRGEEEEGEETAIRMLVESHPESRDRSATRQGSNHMDDEKKAGVIGDKVNPPPSGTRREGLGGDAGSGTDGVKKPLYLDIKSRFLSFTEHIPDKHRVRAKEEYTGVKEYLVEEFPQERRDQFVWRLKKVVVECQATESYQASISWFLTVLHTYFTNARTLAESHASQTNELFTGDPTLGRALSELRMMAERGAGGMNLDDVLKAVDVLWNDAREDAEMRKWWENIEGFVQKTLLQPGYITSSQFTSQSRKLRNSGRVFFTQKYKTHTDSLVDAAQVWGRAWLGDPLNVQLAEGWGKLVRDLLFDDNERLVFKSPLWKDMRTIILPAVVRKIGVVPIPRVEYIDDNLDLVIENLTLQGANLFPKVIEVKAEHYSKLSPLASAGDEHHNSLTLTLSGIQADMRDVAFYFRRKRGLGKIKDEGLADVFIGGRGITVRIQLTTASGKDGGEGNSIFTVKDVHVKVEELKFTIRESKHDFLYRTLRPMATRLIKKQIAKVFSDGIRTALEYIDEQLVAARKGMAKTESEDGSRQKVLKELWNKQVAELSSIKSKQDSTFRVVPKRESMLLPDKGHRKGWIRRQAEKDAGAREGEGWRSEVFNMTPITKATS